MVDAPERARSGVKSRERTSRDVRLRILVLSVLGIGAVVGVYFLATGIANNAIVGTWIYEARIHDGKLLGGFVPDDNYYEAFAITKRDGNVWLSHLGSSSVAYAGTWSGPRGGEYKAEASGKAPMYFYLKGGKLFGYRDSSHGDELMQFRRR